MKVPHMVPHIGEEEYREIKDCLDAKWLSEGPKAARFMELLLSITEAEHGVLAPNGTLALYMALRAVGVELHDLVIVPDSTMIGSSNAVMLAGAVPVFVDVNLDTWQMDIPALQSLLGELYNIAPFSKDKIKAVMPVHLCGHSMDMPWLMKVVRHYPGLKVVEDASQALGVFYNQRHPGTFGDAGVFSFFSDKSFTTGEGGAVITNDAKVYEKLRYLRCQGRLNKGSYIHPEEGYNFYMTDLQAAIGVAQLNKFTDIVVRKLSIYKRYVRNLEGLEDAGKVVFPIRPSESTFIPFRVFIRTEALAEDLIKYLVEREIGVRSFYYPLHKQPCYAHLDGAIQRFDDAVFPNSIKLYQHAVMLPVFPDLTDEQIDYVCDAIKEYFR